MQDSLCSNNTTVRKQRSSPLNCFNAPQVILDSVLKLNLHFQLKHVTNTFFLPCIPLTLKCASRASTDKSALVNVCRSFEKRPLFHTLTVSHKLFFFPGSLYKPFNQELCQTFRKARHSYYAGNICIFGPDR